MRIDILTLFPEMCETVMSESIIGRARRAEKVEIVCTNIRDFAGNKHNKVDDMPYGGGMGMIMAADPIYNCYKSLVSETEEKPRVIYMSPKGEKFTQEKARELSRLFKNFYILCGGVINIGAALLCYKQRFYSAPFGNFCVITRKQHLGHFFFVPHGGAGILRVFKQPRKVAFLFKANIVR